MSILIPGMKMPENCLECDLLSFDEYCPFTNVECLNIGRQDSCPLVEVPTPHGRLIDSDVNVNEYIETWECNCLENCKQIVMAVDDLNYLPTIIESEGTE